MSGSPREKIGDALSNPTSRAAAAELSDVTLGPATRFAALPDPFLFWRGGALSEVTSTLSSVPGLNEVCSLVRRSATRCS